MNLIDYLKRNKQRFNLLEQLQALPEYTKPLRQNIVNKVETAGKEFISGAMEDPGAPFQPGLVQEKAARESGFSPYNIGLALSAIPFVGGELKAVSKTKGAIKTAEELAPKAIKFAEEVAPKAEKLVVGGGKYATEAFNLADDLTKYLTKTAKEIEPEIKYARRGVVDWEKTTKDAEKITINQILERQRGQGVNNAFIAATANHVKKVSDDIGILTNTAQKLEDAGKPSTQIKREIGRQVTLYKALLSETLGSRTETGRALNAAKIYARNLQTPRQVLISDVLKNASDYRNTDAIVDKLMLFGANDRTGMIKFLSQVKPSDPAQKIEAIWYNNILSAPSTHLANSIGNLGRTLWHDASKPLRVGSDIVASKISGQPREEFMREWGPEIVGTIKGFKDGVRKAVGALKTGIRSVETENLTVPTNALKGKLGAAYSTPTRALLAEDELFRGINRTMELYRMAANKAVKAGFKGEEFAKKTAEFINAPTPDMIKKADELANELLFMKGGQELLATGGLRDLIKIKLPLLGETRPMRFFVPFVTTPINILKFATETSPVGLAATVAGAKNLDRLSLNRKLASGIMGTAVYAALATYVTEDKVTGRAPVDKTEKDAWFATGKQPYSINIGGHWVQYNRFPEPIATALTSIAAMHDAFNQTGDIPTGEKIQDGVLGIARSFSDRSFLSGLGDLLDVLESPEQRGKKSLQRLTTSMAVPWSSLTGAVARSKDRTVREADTYLQALKSAIPGWSKSVPAQPSAFEEGGEAVRKAPAWQEFMPFKTTQEEEAPEARKYLKQSEIIKQGKPMVVSILKQSKVYQSATAEQQASLERGAQQSFSMAVREGKDFNVENYLKNQKTVEVTTRARGTSRSSTRKRAGRQYTSKEVALDSYLQDLSQRGVTP